MRSTGILRSWNDERGFGFIAPTQGGAELFVHVSAPPRDGSRPVVGETLSFELGRGRDGRVQAVNVLRTAIGTSTRSNVQSGAQSGARPSVQPVHGRARAGQSSRLGLGLALLAVVMGSWWGHGWYQAAAHRRHLESMPPAMAQPAPGAPREAATPMETGFRCDGRTHCSQMTSCAEATWFINHCPGTQMDGDHDGVPCERQWCASPGAR
ncbi:excalibur calcium-binding domain-containing protein [Roseateles sp.]|uniref:excalibur calcium-binding domain-containing protein n=1 Tax=Roseateles sp. TaxID=1971397 RepID=UPI0039E80E51